ncbi:hypothetical protein A3F29_01775 [Candidatus Roizmanbacteria bacterium RIFCSPHIGHO2_12_FULL_33_9]|uniref:Uncharacterized protein n=1 Tax=Candidatus Roizmanbacteria bacterium RIFCSPHIGHO2_12_FULL_33_9 TaxID=1802045 RepID=A0A1F7HJL1_9BACT|nr:MAG: hypothetical protein A3F29_01775 [Candidatus Roizmanbacteria bacterium RIFCSPHIGHO2_12_FULL_33_9]
MFFMITDRDIKKIKKELVKDFITKKEFLQFTNENNNFKLGVNKRFELLEYRVAQLTKEFKEFRDEMREFREQTYKSLDWLVGAFKKFDEEHTILSTRYSTINKTIDNHENRITSLEKSN